MSTWGIYDSAGNAVALADSVVSLDYRSDSRQSEYPQQRGSFASYNKIQMPYMQRVRMSKGGSDADRATFLAELQSAKDSTNLYSVSTPDTQYLNASIVGLDYRREHTQGAYLLLVDLMIQEVRITATASYASTKAPSGSRVVSGGTVQGATPTSQQQASVSNAQ